MLFNDEPFAQIPGQLAIDLPGRMAWTCMTPGCEVVGHFTDEPGFCSICLRDLVGVYDTTGDVIPDA